MMRDIKFRAWDGKRMFDAFDLIPELNRPVGNITVGTFKPSTIMLQYTGMKDRTGKEIYEGDIVDTGQGLIAPVTYHGGCFGVTNSEKGRTIYSTGFEVIGNVYENPDLL